MENFQKTKSLRRCLLIPLMAAFVLLLGLFITVIYRVQQNHIHNDVNDRFDFVRQFMGDYLKSESDQMGAALEVLKTNSRIASHFENRDRQTLLGATKGIFERIRTDFDITHLYFTLPDGKSFLRVHKPDKYGDVISRFTLKKAAETGRIAYGLELGPLGMLTLRVVAPWRVRGETIGFVEMGKEINHIIAHLHKILDINLYVIIEKQFLDRDNWLDGMRMLGRNGDWNRFPESVLVDSTAGNIPPDLEYYLHESRHKSGETIISFSANGRHFRSKFLHLNDVAGRSIGDIVMLQDVTTAADRLNQSIAIVSGICCVIFGSLFLLFYIWVGRTDRQLIEARERLLSFERDRSGFILDNMPAHVSLLDGNGCFAAWNEYAEKVFGYSVAEALHQIRPEDLFEDSDAAGKLISKASCDGWAEIEIQALQKSGKNFWAICRMVKLPESSEILSIMEDISDRREARSKLRQSEEQYRGLMETSTDAIISVEKNGNILHWNKAAENVFGYSRGEMIGRPVEILIPEQYRESHRKGFGCFPDTAGRLIGNTVELEAMHKEGRIVPVELSLSALRREDDRIFTGIIRDITPRKQAEAEKAQLQLQLAQSQKMEALGTLAGGIAHDFNNILSAIIGYADLSFDDLDPDTRLAKNIKQILAGGYRARDLVTQILTFTRQSEKELYPVQIKLIVREAIKLLRASLPSTIEIREQIESESLVMADPVQIHQIVMNICTNASHAMPDGGILTIRLAETAFDSDWKAGVYSLRAGRFIRFSIEDTGKGIPLPIRDRIFEPYFTTKEKGQGTGLGLSVVHGIVEGIGGGIQLTSEMGKGTIFDIYLPMLEEKACPPQSEAECALPRGTERVLLIDDELSIIKMAKQMLEKLGYQVTTACNGIDALAVFEKEPEKFDLIITDMTMPKMTGLDLAKRMTGIRPEIPIILCTGYSSLIPGNVTEITGIRALARKPISKKDLAHMVRRVLNERKLTTKN